MDAASLVSAWTVFVRQLGLAFATEATARTWQQIALGRVLHCGAAVVIGIYRVLGLPSRPTRRLVSRSSIARSRPSA